MTEPIHIADQPRLVTDPTKQGTAIEVPLSRTPDPVWLSFFSPPGVNVERLELDRDRIRFWPVSTDTQVVIEALAGLEAAVAEANTQVEAMQQRTLRLLEERRRLESDLARWWRAKSAASG